VWDDFGGFYLLRAAPGSSLTPLLQGGRGTAILPHGTPFAR